MRALLGILVLVGTLSAQEPEVTVQVEGLEAPVTGVILSKGPYRLVLAVQDPALEEGTATMEIARWEVTSIDGQPYDAVPPVGEQSPCVLWLAPEPPSEEIGTGTRVLGKAHNRFVAGTPHPGFTGIGLEGADGTRTFHPWREIRGADGLGLEEWLALRGASWGGRPLGGWLQPRLHRVALRVEYLRREHAFTMFATVFLGLLAALVAAALPVRLVALVTKRRYPRSLRRGMAACAAAAVAGAAVLALALYLGGTYPFFATAKGEWIMTAFALGVSYLLVVGIGGARVVPAAVQYVLALAAGIAVLYAAARWGLPPAL